MGSVQGERKCPKCGNNNGVYIDYYKTYESCFLCPQCNWGYEIRARWFAQDTLHQLRKLMCDNLAAETGPGDLYKSFYAKERVSKFRKLVRDKPWSEAGAQIERILAVLLSESKAHGYDQGANEVRKFEDIEVRKLEDMIKRSTSQWQDSDWSYIRRLSERWELQAFEDGKPAFDYIESPPKIMAVPQSKLRPMSELIIRDKGEEFSLDEEFRLDDEQTD